jgi:hypothetical protein
MMPAVIVAVAIALMLAAAALVVGLRLMAAVRRLTAVLNGTWKQMEPIVTELREAGEVAGLEAAQLQANIEALQSRRNGQR